jgi:uncharacterized protein YbaA (DUF1428 family)
MDRSRHRPIAGICRVLLTALVLIATGVVAVNTAHAEIYRSVTNHSSCYPNGAKLIFANSWVRVFEFPSVEFPKGRYSDPRWYACNRRTHQWVETFVWSEYESGQCTDSWTTEVLKGPLLAWSYIYSCEHSFSNGIEVIDARTGRYVRYFETDHAHDDPFAFGRNWAEVTAMVLTRRGDVAYVSAAWGHGTITYRVFLAPRRKSRELLDTITESDAKSLRLEGPNVVWTNNGVARSAPIG